MLFNAGYSSIKVLGIVIHTFVSSLLQTVFEINATSKTSDFSVMKLKRSYHGGIVNRKTKKMEDFQLTSQDVEKSKDSETIETASEIDLQVSST